MVASGWEVPSRLYSRRKSHPCCSQASLRWPELPEVRSARYDGRYCVRELSEGSAMPLLDHFHPPLLGHRHWEGFHSQWAAAMADVLNEILPPEYFAEFQVKVGTRVETDIATFTEDR